MGVGEICEAVLDGTGGVSLVPDKVGSQAGVCVSCHLVEHQDRKTQVLVAGEAKVKVVDRNWKKAKYPRPDGKRISASCKTGRCALCYMLECGHHCHKKGEKHVKEREV